MAAAIHSFPSAGGFTAIAALRMRSILSAELYFEMCAPTLPAGVRDLPAVCRDRWTDLAKALAALPGQDCECYCVHLSRHAAEASSPELWIAFAVAAHATYAGEAEARARTQIDDLFRLVGPTLDYAEFELVTDQNLLRDVVQALTTAQVIELRRRVELLETGIASDPLGFAVSAEGVSGADKSRQRGVIGIRHLFPWTVSDDTWWRLVDVMASEPGRAALVVHARGFRRGPALCLGEARSRLTASEVGVPVRPGDIAGVLSQKVAALRGEMLGRLVMVESPVVAARIFLATQGPPSAALLSVVESSIDDASLREEPPGRATIFRGGAKYHPSCADELLAPLDEPSLDDLFSLREAAVVLRTPMPTEQEMAGLPVCRSRTAGMTGRSGDDSPLGLNIHRGRAREVTLDADMRFRHVYIIGQTGTGKSTLMQHMALRDIRAGRGVAVLDPHGALIDDILARYPAERADDLVIVDMADTEWPVGFNVLRILETNPEAYRARRDLLIDDLYAYIDQTYDLKLTGGPMFETHFRAMLALLMGLETPREPHVPNLMVFRMLYTNKNLRRQLLERIRGRDILLEEFVKEAEAAGGEGQLANMAPYITSKFSRFVSDLALRNIICQNQVLDIDDLVAKKRVVLFHLAKGRVGDQAAGLMASQMVSRLRSAVMRRGGEGARTPFHLYADEFHLFANDRFCEMLAEGRKFGLAITMAHQYAGQLPEKMLRAVIGNVGTTILFRVGSADADFFAPVFAPRFGSRDMISLPSFRAYVRSFGSLGATPFNIDIRPPEDGADRQRAEGLRSRTRAALGRPRSEVELEIESTTKAFIQGL